VKATLLHFTCAIAGCVIILILVGMPLPGAESASADAVLASQLVAAAHDDDSVAVAALVARHVDVNVVDSNGATALAWAAMHTNQKIASLLLSVGADPNLVNEHGIGPLALAVENGSLPLVQLFLEKKANPNLPRESGETPLMTATRLGRIDIMKALLARGADVDGREKKFGQTALMWAAGHPDEVRLLVEYGAKLTPVTSTWKVTTTIYTPGFRTLGVTGVPWEFKGDYTSVEGGQNALLFAVQKRDLESVRVLLDAGMDVNASAANGTTALLLALYKWSSRDGGTIFDPDLPMANYLLDHGAKVNVADTQGYTPLHGAVLAASAVNAPMGGGRGPARGTRGAGNRTPVLLNGVAIAADPAAADAVNPADAKAVAETAPPPGRGGGFRRDTIPTAAVNRTEAMAMVDRLLRAGADVNAQTLYPTGGPVGAVRINPVSAGSSSLHIAAISKNAELVRMLNEHGGNPNLIRKDGHSPFSLAVDSNDLTITKDMVEHGADLKIHYSSTDKVPDRKDAIALPRENQSIMHVAAEALAYNVVPYLHEKGASLAEKNSFGETPLVCADNMEVFDVILAFEGTQGQVSLVGGGRVIPRDSRTSDILKKFYKEAGLPDETKPMEAYTPTTN
jgi:ankyrin repeat protein